MFNETIIASNLKQETVRSKMSHKIHGFNTFFSPSYDFIYVGIAIDHDFLINLFNECNFNFLFNQGIKFMSFHAYLKKIFDEKGKFATLDDISLTTKTGTSSLKTG